MVYCGIICIPGGSMFVGTKNVPGSLGCNFIGSNFGIIFIHVNSWARVLPMKILVPYKQC